MRRLALACVADLIVEVRERVVGFALQILELVLDGAEGVVQRDRVRRVLRDEAVAALARLLKEALKPMDAA
jgi:hypothetical protein